MANRKRNIEVRFRVTQDELEMIHKKMAQYGTTNLSAFLRKMSIDGYVVKLELPELKEMVSLLRYSSNNLNQLTKRVHETSRIYDADPGRYPEKPRTAVGRGTGYSLGPRKTELTRRILA